MRLFWDLHTDDFVLFEQQNFVEMKAELIILYYILCTIYCILLLAVLCKLWQHWIQISLLKLILLYEVGIHIHWMLAHHVSEH